MLVSSLWVAVGQDIVGAGGLGLGSSKDPNNEIKSKQISDAYYVYIMVFLNLVAATSSQLLQMPKPEVCMT